MSPIAGEPSGTDTPQPEQADDAAGMDEEEPEDDYDGREWSGTGSATDIVLALMAVFENRVGTTTP